MKKPKPIFKRVYRHTCDSSKSNKNHYFEFEIVGNRDDKGGITVSGGTVDNPSVEDIDRIIKWYQEVRKYIK